MPFKRKFLLYKPKMAFSKNIFGTSGDFHKSAEKLKKKFEPLYLPRFLEQTCGPENIQNN
jgi:hypothetical protein